MFGRRRKSFNLELLDERIVDKLKLWLLRGLLYLGGLKEFLSSSLYFSSNDVALLLGLEEFVDQERIDKKKVRQVLEKELMELEEKESFSTLPTLQNNIDRFANLLSLNETEKKILEFTALLHYNEFLGELSIYLNDNIDRQKLYKMLAIFLDEEIENIKKALAPDAKLIRSSLIKIQSSIGSLKSMIDIIDEKFIDRLVNIDSDITDLLKDWIKRCDRSDLELCDFIHIEDDVHNILTYLKKALDEEAKGVNILFYGVPGTGKTELSKVIAKELGVELYEISYTNDKDEFVEGFTRLRAYKMAQELFCNRPMLLLYDEAEDIFDIGTEKKEKQQFKAWINRSLETNSIATIWITNYVERIDPAILRRFDYILELPVPPKRQREKIVKKYIDHKISLVAQHEELSPALISRAAKVAKKIENKDAFVTILNNTLKAQGKNPIKEKREELPSFYDPSFINSSVQLEELISEIEEHQSARLCFYGVPGSGKSAFAKFLAKHLEKPLIVKRGSDLLSMWVGGTEANIAAAFKEAKEEGAVLVFDEVDGFLADRRGAVRNWEVTQVNELLVQMEEFDGIFIATTNLMEHLDRASLRRFDLKVEFSYLNANQFRALFEKVCEELGIEANGFEFINRVTLGDVALLLRQHRFYPIKNGEDLLKRLKEEIGLKKYKANLGFVRSVA